MISSGILTSGWQGGEEEGQGKAEMERERLVSSLGTFEVIVAAGVFVIVLHGRVSEYLPRELVVKIVERLTLQCNR